MNLKALEKINFAKDIQPAKAQMAQAWIWRWNQRIQEAREILAEIQIQQNWMLLEVENLEKQSAGAEREIYLEALLLKGSLMRAQNQEQKSSALLRRIVNKNDQLQDPASFHLLFELALDCWRREDMTQALDYFLLADRKARNPVEQTLSTSNILWCLENLDLETGSVEKKLMVLLDGFKQDENSPIFHAQQLWTAYKIRRLFYKDMAIPKRNPQDPTNTGLGDFLTKWICELPYTRQPSLVPVSQNSAYLWQGTYRQRTLMGLWTPEDSHAVRLSDAIDRLYLWVWKWMVSDLISKEKLIWTLESILRQLELNELSKENSLLLRNACAWLSLTDPILKKRLSPLILRLKKTSGSNYALLGIEFNLILCLRFLDDQTENEITELDDVLDSLPRFPVFDEIYNQYRDALLNPTKSCAQAILPQLQKRAQLKFLQRKYKSHQVLINLETEEIYFTEKEIHVTSPKMILLFQLLHQRKKIHFDDLGDYNDSRNLYNLVARVRRHLATENCLSITDQEIIKGPNWPTVQFLNSRESQMKAKLDSQIVTTSKLQFVKSEAYLQAARALLPEKFDRKKLEKSLKVSKATACRMLEEWHHNKLISKNGTARFTYYQWENQNEKG